MMSLEQLSTASRMAAGRDLATICALLARSQGSLHNAAVLADHARVSSRVREVLKTAIAAGTLSELPEFLPIASGFVQSLANAGAFDTVAASGAIRLGFDRRGFLLSSSVTVGTVREGAAIPVRAVEIAADLLDAPTNAAAILVLTEELMALAPGAADLIERELRRATIGAVDRPFLSTMADAGDAVTSTGSIAADLSAALDTMDVDSASRLVLVAPSADVRRAALVASNGLRDFPELTVNGGTIAGIRVVPSDFISGSPQYAVLIDATGLAIAESPLELDVATHAALEMRDDPTAYSAGGSPLEPKAASTMVSLWQTNSRGIRSWRSVAYAPIRAGAVCRIDDLSWA
jgi:hypothetical protein